MNAAQVHLALNHLPVIGILLGVLVLIAGFFLKSLTVRRVGVGLVIFAAIMVVPVYLSGEGAEEIVEHQTGVSESLIHDHEEFAELALLIILGAGGLAAATLFLEWRRISALAAFSEKAVVVVGLISFGVLAQTAHLGGLIQHEELRSNGQTVEQTSGDRGEGDDD